MEKTFRYVLLACLLALIAHMGMTVAAERASGARYFETEEGRSRMASMRDYVFDAYAEGGEAANSALVLYFGDGQGPDTTEAHRSEVFFDFDGSGRSVQTGWIGVDSGLLLLAGPDFRAGSVSGLDLFGNHMPDDIPAEAWAHNTGPWGFELLKRYDADQNGRIDAGDPIWPRLNIWRDYNHDGRIDAGELQTLDQLGLSALDLAYQSPEEFLPDHNYLAASSSFHDADGRSGRLDEIYFQCKSAHRKFMALPAPAGGADEALPKINGAGLVRDLNEAAAINPELARMVSDFSRADSREDMMAAMDRLLLAWAATGGLESDPEKRAGDRYRFTDNCLKRLNREQQKYLPVIDAWAGRYSYRLPGELYPGQEADPKIISNGTDGRDLNIVCPENEWRTNYPITYTELRGKIFFALSQETRLKAYFDLLDRGPEYLDSKPMLELFDRRFAENSRRAVFDLVEVRIILAMEYMPSRRLPGLDDYIERRIGEVVIDDDLNSMYGHMLKRIRWADHRDRQKRLAIQWGVDKVNQAESPEAGVTGEAGGPAAGR